MPSSLSKFKQLIQYLFPLLLVGWGLFAITPKEYEYPTLIVFLAFPSFVFVAVLFGLINELIDEPNRHPILATLTTAAALGGFIYAYLLWGHAAVEVYGIFMSLIVFGFGIGALKQAVFPGRTDGCLITFSFLGAIILIPTSVLILLYSLSGLGIL